MLLISFFILFFYKSMRVFFPSAPTTLGNNHCRSIAQSITSGQLGKGVFAF